MVRKLIGLLIVFCLVLTTPLVVEAASIKKPIQLLVNNKQIDGVIPIIKSGVMYVPYRKFFDALGYKVAFDSDTGEISGTFDGTDISFWAGEDMIETNVGSYYLDDVIPVYNGQAYIPLRRLGHIVDYSVHFDPSKLTVNFKSYGYGEEAAVKELVTMYYETYNPHLLAYDHPRLRYTNLDYEANQEVSEIPVRSFKVTIDKIEYTSENEAKLQVTYIKHTEELNREDMYIYHIRYEHGQWRISRDGQIYNKMELPEDIDQKAASIKEKHSSEYNAVLSDLRTYYAAHNAEDLNQTLQYTAPSFIKHWDNNVAVTEWKDILEASFLYSDARYLLSNERVVFLGEKEAVVQGTLSWSDPTEDVAEGDHIFEALIYMEYASDRWTYNHDFSLDQDFDDREEFSMFN